MVHVVDTDEELMWTDDHDPPTPTSAVEAGQTIEYTRTMFVPIFPYVGDATIQVGLYSTERSEARCRWRRRRRAARRTEWRISQLLPQTENLFTVFKDGWHPAEGAPSRTRRRVAVDEEGRDARVQEPEEGCGVLPRRRQPRARCFTTPSR